MARIRSVHPGLWTDEAFVSAPIGARLLFIGLWNEADDQGIFEWKPLGLKMRLMPADDSKTVGNQFGSGGEMIENLLQELVSVGLIRQFWHNAKCYAIIKNFRKWQRPKK